MSNDAFSRKLRVLGTYICTDRLKSNAGDPVCSSYGRSWVALIVATYFFAQLFNREG